MTGKASGGSARSRASGRSAKDPYETIRSGIVDGTYRPGMALIEVQFAELCGVSRTPVREALNRLEHDGLIERSQRGGYFVRKRSPEEICDLYEVRINLEGLAATVAAQRRGRLDLMRIDRALTTWEVEGEGLDPMGRARLNEDFHRSIWMASGSEPLIDLLNRLNLHLTLYPSTTMSVPGRWDASVKEHRQLVEAIRAQDAERASEIATKHFTAALEIRLALFEENMLV